MPAKSITPSFNSRSMVLSSMLIWSSGVMSAVIAPFDASVIVLRQNGTSSWIDAGVGPFNPMTLNWLFGRSCAAAEAMPPARTNPVNKRRSICDLPSFNPREAFAPSGSLSPTIGVGNEGVAPAGSR